MPVGLLLEPPKLRIFREAACEEILLRDAPETLKPPQNILTREVNHLSIPLDRILWTKIHSSWFNRSPLVGRFLLVLLTTDCTKRIGNQHTPAAQADVLESCRHAFVVATTL